MILEIKIIKIILIKKMIFGIFCVFLALFAFAPLKSKGVVLYPYSTTICSGIQLQEKLYSFPLGELSVIQNCKGEDELKDGNPHSLDRYWMNHRTCHCSVYNICYNTTCYDQVMTFNATGIVQFEGDDDDTSDRTFYCNLMTPPLPPDFDDDWDQFHDGPYIIPINCTNEDGVNFIGDVVNPRVVSPNTVVPVTCVQYHPQPAGLTAPLQLFGCSTSTDITYCLNATLPVNLTTDVNRASCEHQHNSSGMIMGNPSVFLAIVTLLMALLW